MHTIFDFLFQRAIHVLTHSVFIKCVDVATIPVLPHDRRETWWKRLTIGGSMESNVEYGAKWQQFREDFFEETPPRFL